MSARKRALARMEIAGYHADQRARVRLIVESRVNRQAMNDAWDRGVSKKAAGWACGCFDCTKAVA